MSAGRPAQRYRYTWGELILASSRQLPELTRRPRTPATLHLKWTRAPVNARTCEWIHSWIAPGRQVWLRIGRVSGGYVFRFRRFADFHWSPSQRVLTCHLRARTQMSTVRHLLLDQVLPAIASGEYGNGLHASAVVIGCAAVAFAG